MTVRVLYFTKKGKTEELSQCIAEHLKCRSELIEKDTIARDLDVMFLGAGSYGGKPHARLIQFIDRLEPEKIKRIALFGTSAKGDDAHLKSLAEIIKKKGFVVDDQTFVCPCKGKHPDDGDFTNVLAFTKSVAF